jgi:subtilisin family serine protease
LDIDRPENFTYPACFALDNILTVGSIDFRGDLMRYKVGDGWKGSNYGPRNTHIAALEENYTTDVTNGGRSVYRLGGGTSCAAPVVTGIAALTLSVNPGLSATALKKLLMDTATRLPALKGKVACGGMVNAYKALLAARAAR